LTSVTGMGAKWASRMYSLHKSYACLISIEANINVAKQVSRWELLNHIRIFLCQLIVMVMWICTDTK
jgi:hypothetical protein